MNEKLNFRILKSKDDARFVRSLEIENQRFIDNDNISQNLYDLDIDKVDIEVNIWKQIYILEDEHGERLGYGLIRYYPADRTADFTYCIKEASRGKGYGKYLLQYLLATVKFSRFADLIKVKVFKDNMASQCLLLQFGFDLVGPIPNGRQLMPNGRTLAQDYYIAYKDISSEIQSYASLKY